MAKLAKPTWFYILAAAKEFNGKPFTPTDLIDKVKEKAPRAKRSTILCNLYGMTPNHPSSQLYPSLKKHATFIYQRDWHFQMLEKES
jgi:hypothetical protein